MGNEKLLLIINPISGTLSKEGLGDRIKESLTQSGFDVECRYTDGPGDATKIAKYAADNDYYGVIACGGDGTVNETAKGLCGSKTALGIIPAGSGNGLARHISIPVDPLASLDIIKSRCIKDCDYGTVNDIPFFCTFGVGFDAAVSHRFANQAQRGQFSYLKSVVEVFVNYKPQHYHVNIDGKDMDLDAFILTCCNASQYGNNAYISPEASITDGILDMVVIKKSSQLRTFFLGFDLMAGVINNNTLTTSEPFSRLIIDRENEGPAHIDGEVVYFGKHIEVECKPRGLRVFVNKNKTPFKPILTPAEALFNDIKIRFANIFQSQS
jgi:YegS/Rv2252/BmrU family lipid kinase